MATETTKATRRQHSLKSRLAIRRDYVEGGGPLTTIAAAHGVSRETVKGWATAGQWGSARRRWATRQIAEPPTPSLPPGVAHHMAFQPPNDDEQGHAQASIGRLERALTQLDDAIEIATKADDLHKLSTARQRLFEQWRVLSGVPLPGSKRPPKDAKQKISRAGVEPE
jgi:transposase-like protein